MKHILDFQMTPSTEPLQKAIYLFLHRRIIPEAYDDPRRLAFNMNNHEMSEFIYPSTMHPSIIRNMIIEEFKDEPT